MDSTELQRIGNQQLNTIGMQVIGSTSGSYFITDLSVVDENDKMRLLNWLLARLSRTYHQFVWKQTESLNPSERGILVSWQLRQYGRQF